MTMPGLCHKEAKEINTFNYNYLVEIRAEMLAGFMVGC
jgi:hypothetical protein